MNTTPPNSAEITPGQGGPRLYQRFDEIHRAQHVLMITSFVTCVVTGFPLKYPDWAWMGYICRAVGGIGAARVLHRVGAVIMIAAFTWHLVDLLLRFRRSRPALGQIEILPRLQDFKDLARNVGYFIGLTDRRPRFGRFNYMHKFDYLAVFGGMAIMVTTGLVQ